MGVALLAAGVIAMPKLAEQFGRVNLNSWPIGFRGSWRLLSPGILVLVVPSMIATFTDPATDPVTDPATGFTAAITPTDQSAPGLGPFDDNDLYLSVVAPDGHTAWAAPLDRLPVLGPVLATIDGAATVVDVSAAVQTGGPIARVGQRLIGSVTKMMLDRFFECLKTKLQPSS